MEPPCYPAAERNKHAILNALLPRLAGARRVLELGSGSGQHAVHFARHLPHLTWQPSDLPAMLPGIGAQVARHGGANLVAPIALDVGATQWPALECDAVYAANLVHTMPVTHLASLFAGVAALLAAGHTFLLYGPFNRDGHYESEGNRRLDAWLRAQDGSLGVRDVAELAAAAADSGFGLCEDLPMPANNHLLVWRRL